MEEKKERYGFGPLVENAEDFLKFKETIQPVVDEEMKNRLDSIDTNKIGENPGWVSLADFTSEDIMEDEDSQVDPEKVKDLWKWLKAGMDAGYILSLFKI